jgi:membrane protein
VLQNVSPESPEARRKRLARTKARFGHMRESVGPGTRAWEILKRVFVGVYNDGFIHAGNLAYLALLSLFPFVIVAAAVTRLFGASEQGIATVTALLQTMPPDIADLLRRPITDVIQARTGNLLWLGALVGLWTTGSFIETIRDIIRRAYGVTYSRPFWEYRLISIGIIIGAVLMAMTAFTLSIMLSSIEQFLVNLIPGADDLVGTLALLRIVPALMLFGSLYLLFYWLTPKRYRGSSCRKWPGPLFVSVWWIATTALLPVALSSLGSYDLTYGSLAGVIIALFFFFIIGFGMVIGAELNAALAETPTPTHEDIIEAVKEEEAEQAQLASRDRAIDDDEKKAEQEDE